MEKIKSVYKSIYTPRVREIGRIFFYIALFAEVLIFLMDRADWYNPYQSMMFRVTFVLFLIKCICTDYTPREWVFIAVCAAFCLLAYSVNIKDEIIRAMVFIISLKGMDVRRVLKFNYWCQIAGIVILALLSVFGVMGDVFAPAGYAEKADLTMLGLGLGSSNTLAIQIWLFVSLGIYLYHERLNVYSYALILGLGFAVYFATHCRTAFLMTVFTVVGAFLLDRYPKLARSASVYIAGVVLTLLSVAFSVYAAATSKWVEEQNDFELFLNRITTGRIQSIYPFMNGGGVLSNWRLFGAPNYIEYFDMGLVRLFWWYGIIPGALAILAVLFLMYHQYRHHDHEGYFLLLSIVLFSVLEAHFVSVFLARAVPLFMLGGVWSAALAPKDVKDRKHIAFYIGSLAKGGAERVFVNLAEYFLSEGYEVTMITQYVRENEYELPAGARRVISDLTESETRGRIYNFAARIVKLHRIIRDTDADLLMTTIGKANFMAITCAAFLPTRVVVSVVADPPLEYPTTVMRILLQTLFGDADGIVMQTDRQRDCLRCGLRAEAVILPNSVSPQFIRDRFSGQRKKDIYMVGRLDENKNQQMAMTAFEKLSHEPESEGFRLVICGDGPDRDKLSGLKDSLGIGEKVCLAGAVGDVPDRLYDAYAFVLTSDTEGMPNTLLEAMSLGLACISTDCPCGGPAQIIDDGVNGMLVPVGDADALADSLGRLMRDAVFADNLGCAAYESMIPYRPEAVNAKWKEYFDGIIAGNI